jgi:hypothetical protein
MARYPVRFSIALLGLAQARGHDLGRADGLRVAGRDGAAQVAGDDLRLDHRHQLLDVGLGLVEERGPFDDEVDGNDADRENRVHAPAALFESFNDSHCEISFSLANSVAKRVAG